MANKAVDRVPVLRHRLVFFPGTDLDCVAIGHCFLRKDDQEPSLERERVDSFEPN